MEVKHRKLDIVLFCLYSGLMLYLLFHRAGGIEGMDYWKQIQAKLNLEPFHTIRLFLKVLGSPAYNAAAVINLGGNVFLFIPLGFFLPRIFPSLQKFRHTILVTFLIITAVELTQLFTLLGTCDIDDLILNVIGAAIGYGIFILQAKKPAQ